MNPSPSASAENAISTISQSPATAQSSPTAAARPTTTRRAQYLASLSCAGGGFAFGTVLGWAAPASAKWYGTDYDYYDATRNSTASAPMVAHSSFFDQEPFHLTPNEFSWVVSIFAVGGALTAIPAGLMLQYLGRKITVFIFLLPLCVGWMLVMFASNFLTILIGRLLLGISCGTSSVIVPIYSAEISEPEIRGRTGALYQTMVNTGILFMFALGPFVNLPTLVFISALVTLVFYAFYYFAPESPTFLVRLPINYCSHYHCHQSLSPLPPIANVILAT